MGAFCVIERITFCKGFQEPRNGCLVRVGRISTTGHSTGVNDDLQTGNKSIEMQTQEYDYFGKKSTPVFPKGRQGADMQRKPESIICHESEDVSATNRQYRLVHENESTQPEYRVMNPIYRITKEYSFHSNQMRSKRSRNRPISVLVMDEGGEIRSRLAAAMLVFLLENLRKEITVNVEVASIGPPSLGEANDVSTAVLTKMVKLWMNNDTKALELVEKTPRQFQEVKDPLQHDILLVMDRYDLRETLREVSVLDALSPGNYYSSKVKRITPFAAHIRAKGGTRTMPFQQDIPDPLYFSKDVPTHSDLTPGFLDDTRYSKYSKEAQNINTLSRDLAYCCKGVVDMLQTIHGGVVPLVGSYVKPRDILQQILRCPGLWMEYPYGRDGRSPINNSSKSRKYWPRPLHPQGTLEHNKRISSRNIKAKGYWKVFKNVEYELNAFMKENSLSTLPSQAMLRKNGKHSLASSVDYHGGLSVFASKMGLKLYKRRPNGFWSNLQVLKCEIRQFIEENESLHDDSMPTARELVKAGRSDLVRAIRMHGGFSEVAVSIGMIPHRSSKHWEEVDILNFLRALKRNDLEISRSSIRDANRPGLESAIDRLGGFPYFLELLEDDKEACALILSDNFVDGSIWSLEKPACERLNCPIPYIERVAKKLSAWMSMKKSHGTKDRLPTKRELEDAGRLDIWRSVQRAGGVQKMSEYLHLPYKETRGRKAQNKGLEKKKTGNLLETWNAYEDFILID